MKQVTITIAEGIFTATATNKIENPLRAEMESMMGGHQIERNNGVYTGPVESLEYFNGIFRMYGFDVIHD
jgi:hypothetical protein